MQLNYMADNTDRKSIGNTIARYGKVSTTMAGLAARLAGERFLGIKIEREEHAQQLLQALGRLKGPLMKVGQILATIPEALPSEYARAFQELQSNAPPMGWPFVRRRMKTELGPDWQEKFKHFDKEAAAAASDVTGELIYVNYGVPKDYDTISLFYNRELFALSWSGTPVPEPVPGGFPVPPMPADGPVRDLRDAPGGGQAGGGRGGRDDAPQRWLGAVRGPSGQQVVAGRSGPGGPSGLQHGHGVRQLGLLALPDRAAPRRSARRRWPGRRRPRRVRS